MTLSCRKPVGRGSSKGSGSAEEGTMTGTTTGYAGQFGKVRGLGGHGEHAADLLTSAYEELRAVGAAKGAERLQRVDEFADQLDFPALERLVDPERAVEEFATARQHRARRLHTARNLLALAPLLLTWAALAWASIDYDQQLAEIPNNAQITKPFLLLWQQHFGGMLIPTFAQFAAADFVLLFAVLALTYSAHHAETVSARAKPEVRDTIDSPISALAIAMTSSVVRPPASAQEWANEAKRIITEAMRQTENLAAAGRATIEEAGAALKDIHAEGRDYITAYSNNITATLNAVRNEYEQFMARTAIQVSEAIGKQMTPLLGQFERLLSEFGAHHETYRTGVAALTAGVTTLGESARTMAASATAHENVAAEVGRNLALIEASQRNFADDVAKSLKSMNTAATAQDKHCGVLKKDIA